MEGLLRHQDNMFALRKKWRLKILVCLSVFVVILVCLKSADYTLNSEILYRQNRQSVLKWTMDPPLANTTKPTENYQPKTMVIILTYMRSGSSFTGDLIQHHPDVFYVYEPLYTMSSFLHNSKKLRFFNKKDMNVKPGNYNKLSLEALEDIFNCNTTNLDVDTLRQYHHKTSLTTKSFAQCIKSNAGIMGIVNCLPLFQKPCNRSKLALVKTIRLDLKETRFLLEKYPTLKIVHLIRDPRGTLRSQKSVGEFHTREAINETTEFCKRVADDLKWSKRLKRTFPKRIKTLRYEDVSEKPIQASQNLYEFLGLEMSQDIKDYIWNITSAGFPDDCVICTTRNNSTATAYKWRNLLDHNIVKIIDKTCSYVYKQMGYVPLKNLADQRNFKVPVKIPIQFET